MAKQSQRPQWSNLPTELLHKISHHHLDTHLDFLRFRAICSSWRHSSAPPRRSLLPSNLPYPINRHDFNSRNWDSSLETQPIPSGHYILTRSIVYLVQPQQTAAGTSWLVKLEEVEQGSKKFRVLSPVSDCQITNVGMEINLLDFRFIEVSKAYYLKHANPSQTHEQTFKPCPNPKKVLFFPGVDDEFSVVALNEIGRLNYVKKGDAEWTQINCQILDIVEYDGRLHSVDMAGCATHYSSNYEIQTEITDWSKSSCRMKRALLENCGSLFSVDIERDVDSNGYDYEAGPMGTTYRTATRMKIYCLNEEKHEWEIVNSLGDRILFLGNDCSYSVSATHFAGCKGNVVYHADEGIELQFDKEKQQAYHGDWMDESCYQPGLGDGGPTDDQYFSDDYLNFLKNDMENDMATQNGIIDDESSEEDENSDDELSEEDENIYDDEPNDNKLNDDESGGNEPSGDKFGGDDKPIGDEFGGEDDEPINDDVRVDVEPNNDEIGRGGEGIDDEPADEFGANEPSGDESGGDDKHIGDESGGDDYEPINDDIHVDIEPNNDEIGIGGEGIDDEPVDDDLDDYGHDYSDCYVASPSLPRKAYANVRGASDDVLKGLRGQNIGVFDVQTQKLGSLLMFREGASVFWPPPAWLKNNQN